MPAVELAQEITKLMLKTKRKDGGDVDTALFISAYAEDLRDYPADVVKYVFREAARGCTFTPSWHELYTELEFWNERRAELLEKP